MNPPGSTINEQSAASAFSKQASQFDITYGNNTIIRYKRERVRKHVEQFLHSSSSILELNAGTGDDAIYFAKQGHHVHATDISTGMQQMLIKKVREQNETEKITTELCSFTELEKLKMRGPYDLVFSNFAGLNCTDLLDKVLASVPMLLKPGGLITLVILPKFCFWEFLLLFKGKVKTAFRRFVGKKGSRAHIEGEYFHCWYYNPSYITKRLRKDFELLSLEGLCTIVPPSYIEHFAEKYPKMYRSLIKKEDKLKSKWPWRTIGDYYIITLRKK